MKDEKVLGTWPTERTIGSGRRGAPRQVNGLQAHLVRGHDFDAAAVETMSVHDLALAHSKLRDVKHLRG